MEEKVFIFEIGLFFLDIQNGKMRLFSWIIGPLTWNEIK